MNNKMRVSIPDFSKN